MILPLLVSILAFAEPIDWSQPPVACVEEILPQIPERPCLDLSSVTNPQTEWPALSDEELQYWQSRKHLVQYCRAQEIQRREALAPGSFSSSALELAWMQSEAVNHQAEKVAAVYSASRNNQIPAQVLAGALYQESLFTELGVAEDGSNYSCGVGQVNVIEWCHWMSRLSATQKRKVRWPSEISCSSLDTLLVKPFYQIARTRLAGLPEYRLQKNHFADISFDAVVKDFPVAPIKTQRLRYQAVTSFIHNCSDAQYGIEAKGHELARLYKNYIPRALKEKDLYRDNEQYSRKCNGEGHMRAYPLHLGWLLAVGAYNAGPAVLDFLAHYNKWQAADLNEPKTWKNFGPHELVESFYWSGKYNPQSDKMDFTSLKGKNSSWLWFKACVLQRHIARVIQHSTLAGVPNLVDSLEGTNRCAKSVFDPNTGELIQSGVPLFRQISSGTK